MWPLNPLRSAHTSHNLNLIGMRFSLLENTITALMVTLIS